MAISVFSGVAGSLLAALILRAFLPWEDTGWWWLLIGIVGMAAFALAWLLTATANGTGRVLIGSRNRSGRDMKIRVGGTVGNVNNEGEIGSRNIAGRDMDVDISSRNPGRGSNNDI
jgi:hypothetical protein